MRTAVRGGRWTAHVVGDKGQHMAGKLNKLTVKLEPRKLTADEEKLLMEQGQRNNRASE